MKNKKYILFILILVATVLIFTGQGCKKKKTETQVQKIEINWWRLWDSQDIFDDQISAYQKAHPGVKINYRKLTYTEYEKEVLDALAAGKGPDIWSIHNTWLPKHIDKLASMPDSIMTPDVYRETFVDVASDDLTGPDHKIYGIPFSVDTLALYYNKDFLGTAGIANPPTNWTEFKEDVKKLTRTDAFGNITLAGAALGTAKNVNRAVDILYLLMLQNGTEMVDEKRTKATFDAKARTAEGETYVPGLDALIFYTDFANPKKAVYTWNPVMPYSIDAFAEEKAAMMFNYSYQDAAIKAKAPKLNYAVAPVPQIEGTTKEVNFATYWAEVVSKTSPNQEIAWDFLAYLAKKENIKSYVDQTKRPASRRDVIEEQLTDPFLKIFAKQALTAKSWYQVDSAAIEGIFTNVIESVALGEKDPEKGLKEAADQVTALMKVRGKWF